MRNLISLVMVVAGLGVLPGCVKIPPHNFQAPPPPNATLPPAPSSATVRLEAIESAPISAALISALPSSLDADRVPGGCMNPCYHFKLQTFDAVLRDGRLVASPTYRGSVQAKEDVLHLIPGACDLDPVNVNVVVEATPVIKRKDGQWVLSLADVSMRPSIGPGSDTHCVIGGLVDASGKLQDKLNDMAGSMKAKLEALSFPIPVDDLAARLQGPISIKTNGPQTICVYPAIGDLQLGAIDKWQPPIENLPFIVAVSPIRTSLPSYLQFPIAFLGSPMAVVTTASACSPPMPVPAATQLVPGATQLPFQLVVALAAHYPALSDAVTGTLKPTQGRWGPLKLTVQPERLQLANSNGQVLAALTLSGSVSGTVYFWGTPTVSADGTSISVPNLTLAAESRTALAAKNARLPDFVANLFRKPIQDAVALNLREQLPQSGGTEPISYRLGERGILNLGRLQITIVSVKSIDGELQGNILIKGDPRASP